MDTPDTPATQPDIEEPKKMSAKTDTASAEENAGYNALVERIENFQTKFLDTLDRLVHVVEVRFKARDAMEAELRKRLADVEERLAKLESKINLPNYPVQ